MVELFDEIVELGLLVYDTGAGGPRLPAFMATVLLGMPGFNAFKAGTDPQPQD